MTRCIGCSGLGLPLELLTVSHFGPIQGKQYLACAECALELKLEIRAWGNLVEVKQRSVVECSWSSQIRTKEAHPRLGE
jgi:hypothetical protein